MAAGRTPVILSIDQGTTNTKAALVTADARLVSVGAAPVGVSSPQSGWVEQDAERIWESVLEAVRGCLANAKLAEPHVVGMALSTQRETVVGWRASSGEPLGPAIGWQDRRTAAWCVEALDAAAGDLVRRRTAQRVDAMFSAPKIRWILDHLPAEIPLVDVRVGTVDSWLIWQLTGGVAHLCEAGNASRTLLYDITELDWQPDLLDTFGVPRSVLPTPLASDRGFGTVTGLPGVPDQTPLLAVLADSHAALYGHGCTGVGQAKATYGTGSSVMTPVEAVPEQAAEVSATLAWLLGDTPTYALEGNILSSGATLAWTAELLADGSVAELVTQAESVVDSSGVTLVPAFSGLGAPHWDRDAHALISGLTMASTRGHVARAAVDSIAHQICDIVDRIEHIAGPLRTFRADGGATASDLVVQTQANLLNRAVEVSDVAEVSALGAAKLAWAALGEAVQWPATSPTRVFTSRLDSETRGRQRRHWRREVNRARFDDTAHDDRTPASEAVHHDHH